MERDIILQKAANESRGLAIDAIAARSSGHLGLPLGCAEIGSFRRDFKVRSRAAAMAQPRQIYSERRPRQHVFVFLAAHLRIQPLDRGFEEI